jgi:hypothetical protein
MQDESVMSFYSAIYDFMNRHIPTAAGRIAVADNFASVREIRRTEVGSYYIQLEDRAAGVMLVGSTERTDRLAEATEPA